MYIIYYRQNGKLKLIFKPNLQFKYKVKFQSSSNRVLENKDDLDVLKIKNFQLGAVVAKVVFNNLKLSGKWIYPSFTSLIINEN